MEVTATNDVTNSSMLGLICCDCSARRIYKLCLISPHYQLLNERCTISIRVFAQCHVHNRVTKYICLDSLRF